MKKLFFRFVSFVILWFGWTMEICAQTTYVFHTTSRSALPITVTVNGHNYKLIRTCEYPKVNDGTCLTVNVPGSMSWAATDRDGDRMTKYERGQVTKNGRKIVYIRIIATTKVHKYSSNKSGSSNTYSNRSYSNSNGSFKEKLADGLTGLAVQAIGNLMDMPSMSELLIRGANNGNVNDVESYGVISFWGAKNTFHAKIYGDIPLNHTVTINCLIHNNHIPYAYNPNKFREHDAEIGFMWGRGLGVDVNLEEADSYFRQAYERANDSKLNESEKQLINLAKADVLIRTAKKDTLEALDLIATAMNTTSEDILNGNLPKPVEEKGSKSIDPFDCYYYSGLRGVESYINLSSSIDLANILWKGCKSFAPDKAVALQIFRRIRDANKKEEGIAQLEVGNALMKICDNGECQRDILDLKIECYTIASQCMYKEYRSKAFYSLASIYMYEKPVLNLEKADKCLKEAKKTENAELKGKIKNLRADLKRIKKELKGKK